MLMAAVCQQHTARPSDHFSSSGNTFGFWCCVSLQLMLPMCWALTDKGANSRCCVSDFETCIALTSMLVPESLCQGNHRQDALCNQAACGPAAVTVSAYCLSPKPLKTQPFPNVHRIPACKTAWYKVWHTAIQLWKGVHVQVDDFLQAIKVYIRMIQLACGDRKGTLAHWLRWSGFTACHAQPF